MIYEKKILYIIILLLRIINFILTIIASILIYTSPGNCLYFKEISSPKSSLIGCTDNGKIFKAYGDIYNIYIDLCATLPLVCSFVNLSIYIILKWKLFNLPLDQLTMQISISVVVYLCASISQFVIYTTFPEAVDIEPVDGFIYFIAIDGYLAAAIIYFFSYIISFVDLIVFSKKNFGIEIKQQDD